MMLQQEIQNTKPDNSSAEPTAQKGIIPALVENGKIVLIVFLVAILLKTFIIDAYNIPSSSMENTLNVGDFILVNKLAYGIRVPHYVPFTNLPLPRLTIPIMRSVHRGDVIVFEFPGYKNEVRPPDPVNFVKRCIGLPGDKVEIKNGVVSVNEERMPFPRSGKNSAAPGNSLQREGIFPDGSGFTGTDYGPINVPKEGDVWSIDRSNIDQWRVFIEREGHTVGLDDNSVIIDGKAASSYRIGRNYYFVLGDNRNNSLDSRYWGFVPVDNVIGEALLIYWSWNPENSASGSPVIFSAIQWDRIGTLIR